ncbi:putative ribonuclease H-like domain-containing protein [Tanacetum coccineum]
MIEGNDPKWLFDIDSLTQSMNHVSVTAGTISNDSVGTSEENIQDCIMVQIIENDEQERFADDSSTKDVNAAGQQVNIASPDVNTGSLKLNAEEVNVTQPPGFKDPDHPDKVYKVVKALYGLHQAPRAWSMEITLSLAQQIRSYILDKYVAEILKKLNYSNVKSASTPVDLEKPLVKDGDADDVDVHLYRSMIGSLMYLTASRPDIIFAVCLWYSRDSPFEMVAYTDSDYARATQDKKSTTGGCQFLGNRLISWQCKKQTVVATSTTEAEYVAAACCCGQGIGSGSGSRCQDTILGDVNAQTRFEIPSKQSINPPLSRGYTLGSGEDSMKLIGIDGILQLPRYTSDKKKVTVTESSIRRDLHLDDAEGTDCLPTTTIFEELARMGSSMASLIICLATNQKINLSKYIFDAMVKHLDGGVKFLMYPRSGPMCQDTILGDVNAQTRFEITSKQSIDPPLSRGYTLGSGEDSMKLIGIDGILYTTVI